MNRQQTLALLFSFVLFASDFSQAVGPITTIAKLKTFGHAANAGFAIPILKAKKAIILAPIAIPLAVGKCKNGVHSSRRSS